MENNLLNKEIEEIKQGLKEHEKRINGIEQDKKMQIFQYEALYGITSEMKADIREIKQQLNKPKDLIVNTILTALLTGTIAFLISKVFK